MKKKTGRQFGICGGNRICGYAQNAGGSLKEQIKVITVEKRRKQY